MARLAMFTIGDERLCPWATVGSDLGGMKPMGMAARAGDAMRFEANLCQTQRILNDLQHIIIIYFRDCYMIVLGCCRII